MKFKKPNKKILSESIERIEDEEDLALYQKAMAEFLKNPITYTHDEAMKMLGLDESERETTPAERI